MSPQLGPDLVGAGYPISSPLLALLGGTGNAVQPNVPIATNLSLGLGNLSDASGAASAASGSVLSIAVPVSPGTVITKVSFLTGATSSACPSAVTNHWAGLYTGTGSAPGTTGAQPLLIGQTASLSGASVPASTRLDFTFATPQTITAAQAPSGFIYAAYSITVGAASPNVTGPSLISMGTASAAEYLYYPTSPYALYMTSNGATGSAAPATIGTAVRAANPPVVLLS